jgi:hypothetical protein
VVWTREQDICLHHARLTYHARQLTLSKASLIHNHPLTCVHSTSALGISSLPHVLRGRHFSAFQIEEMDFHETTTEPWQPTMLPTSLCLPVAYITSTLVYLLCFYPLAKYPGPFWARVSTIPSWWQTRKQNRHSWLLRLQQKYGMRCRFNLIALQWTGTYRMIHRYCVPVLTR